MPSVKIPLKVQKRSGFDKSHHNALNQSIGTLVPILTDEVIPNTKIYLRFAMAGSLPPLAYDAYMKCYYDVRAFFVPMRLLYGGFEAFFSDYSFPTVQFSGSNNSIVSQKADCPAFSFNYDDGDELPDFDTFLGRNTLADYLGCKWVNELSTEYNKAFLISALPFACYHRIFNDWYRQPNVTKEVFARPAGTSILSGASSDYAAAMMPYSSFNGSNRLMPIPAGADYPSEAKCTLLADGYSLFDLRQINYDYDYFTTALPEAQLSTPMSVNTSGGSFTIQSLRLANSIQQFKELNMLAGDKIVDVCAARYGANLSSAIAQRAIYLGGARVDIASKSVDVTVPNAVTTPNKFQKSVGGTGATAKVVGTDVIIDNFVANEPGYIMVLGAVVPKVTYASGIRRYLLHYTDLGSLVDMAAPELQNLGNQPIYDCEIAHSLGTTTQNYVFGYTDRYAEFMTMEDEVHGELALGGTLESFVAQRYFAFDSTPGISTAFLTVPKTALNNVAAVPNDFATLGFFGQFAFDYKVSQPLAQYSLPSLQNPAYEHGKTVLVHRGGFRF